VFLFILGLLLGFRKNLILARIGKSVGCAAYFLVNWALIYNATFVGYYIRVSDTWRWYPAVIFAGVFVICLLIIWKPFSNKTLLMAAFSLVGVMLALTVVTVLAWTDNAPLPYGDKHWLDGSFFGQLRIIMNETWPVHMASSFFTFVMYLSFRKNQIAARIGKSVLSAVLLLWAWSIPMLETWRLQTPVCNWIVSIICIGIFPICLFSIWKPLTSSRAGAPINEAEKN